MDIVNDIKIKKCSKNHYFTNAILVTFIVFFSSHKILNQTILISELLLLIISFLIILKSKSLQIYKPLFIFFIYIFMHEIIYIFLGSPYSNIKLSTNNLIYICIIFIFMIILPKWINRDKFKKIYFFVVMISVSAIYIQAIQLYIFNLEINPLILFENLSIKNAAYIGHNRPSSFFLEPQHFASFVLPMLIITLTNKRIISSILIIIAILLSTSSQGIILMIIVIVMVISVNRDLKYSISLFIVSSILFIFLFLLDIEFINFAVSKILNVDITDNIRISRAFNVFLDMPISDKLFGTGMHNVNQYISITGISQRSFLPFNRPDVNFLSSLFGNFVHFGFLGGVLFLYLLVKMFINTSHNGKVFVVLLLLTALSQTITFNLWMLFYWLIYFIFTNVNKDIINLNYRR